jgi:hypothetical protein
MMGIHVANSGTNKIYFVTDSADSRSTGALAYPTGQVTYFNFWGWVSANPELEKLETNEFQELLWGQPLPQDEEMWDSVFFSRTTPLSGIIDPKLLVNLAGSPTPGGPKRGKENLAKQIMDRTIEQ